MYSTDKKLLTLPIYKRNGIYYLHTRINGVQVKRSLYTANEFKAKRKALALLNFVAIKTGNPKLTDLYVGDTKGYEVDLKVNILKAERKTERKNEHADRAEHDAHLRLLEALKLMRDIAKAQPNPKIKDINIPILFNRVLTGAKKQQHKKVEFKLGELLEKLFLVNSNRSQSTKSEYMSDAKEFVKLLKNPNVSDINSADIRCYIEWLVAKKNTPRTIDKKVGVIRSLLNFAKIHGHFQGDNPAACQNILSKKQKLNSDAATWEFQQIKQLFCSENFIKLRTAEPDFYYICTLGVLTGMRVSTLASIKKDDLQITVGGCHFIKISKDKTAAGIRGVPISPEIYQELLEFAADRDAIFRFSERKKDGKGSSDPIRKRLDKLKIEIKLVGSGLYFHGFRKFWNNWMLQNEIMFEARCQYIGHEIEHVNVATYGKKFSTDKLGGMIIPVQMKLLTEIRPLILI